MESWSRPCAHHGCDEEKNYLVVEFRFFASSLSHSPSTMHLHRSSARRFMPQRNLICALPRVVDAKSSE